MFGRTVLLNIPILPEAFLILQAKVDCPSFSGNVFYLYIIRKSQSQKPSADFSGTEREREQEKEHDETIKAPPPSGRGLITSTVLSIIDHGQNSADTVL